MSNAGIKHDSHFEEAEGVKDALAKFGDKAPKLVSLTLKDADKFLIELSVGIESHRLGEACIAAHSLKSIMRQINVHSVADIAFEMEKAAKADDYGICMSVWSRLKSSYHHAKAHLETLYD